MRYHALAADYDGTLAHHGVIDDTTWAALRRLKESGRKLIMVTGRELDELLALLPHPELFDRIVAENGALIYNPATKQIRTLAPGPPAVFVAELQRRGVERISVGRVIVATWEPHQDTVLHVIHDLGLELQVIFNKGAVMVLPSGVNKATGLASALDELGLSAHNVVGDRRCRERSRAAARARVRRRGRQRAAVAQGGVRSRHGGPSRARRQRADRAPADQRPRGHGDPAQAPPHPARHGQRAGGRDRSVRDQPDGVRHVGQRQVDADHRAPRAAVRGGLPVRDRRSRGRLLDRSTSPSCSAGRSARRWSTRCSTCSRTRPATS